MVMCNESIAQYENWSDLMPKAGMEENNGQGDGDSDSGISSTNDYNDQEVCLCGGIETSNVDRPRSSLSKRKRKDTNTDINSPKSSVKKKRTNRQADITSTRRSTRIKAIPKSCDAITTPKITPSVKRSQKHILQQERIDEIYARIFEPGETRPVSEERSIADEFIPQFIPESDRHPSKDLANVEMPLWSTEHDLDDETVTEYVNHVKDTNKFDEDQALALLWYHKYNTEVALEDLKYFKPNDRVNWSESEEEIFRIVFEHCKWKDGRLTIHPFRKVLPLKSGRRIVYYYYKLKVEKKSAAYQRLLRENTNNHVPVYVKEFIKKKAVRNEDFYSFLDTCKKPKSRQTEIIGTGSSY